MDDDIEDELDDFDFDESVFQKLDETERQYNESVAARKAASPPSRPLSDKPPPAKRPRIDSPPPKPPPAARAPHGADDEDDTPVVSFDASGNYTFVSKDQPRPTATNRPPNPVASTSTRPAPRQTLAYKAAPGPSRPVAAAAQNARVGPPHAAKARQPTPILPQSLVQPRTQAPQQPAPRPPDVAVSPGNSAIASQLAEMQAKLAKLQEDNESLATSLRSAQDARYTREGEVANLRRKMEESAAEHKAQLLKLKQEKTDAEAARLERERSLKDEMERMKTRFIMRQQELETSTRKRTWSTARKNPASSQMPMTQQTPIPFGRSSQLRPVEQETPAPAARRGGAAGKDKRPALPTFGGFVNSFQASSPVRSPSKLRKQKKPPALDDRSSSPGPSFAGAVASTARVQETPRRAQRAIDPGEGGWPTSSPGHASGMDVDSAHVTSDAPIPGDDDEDDFGIEPTAADMAEEIHQIVLSHWKDHTSVLSLQVLLAANQSPEYSHACSMLMRQGSAEQVGSALIEMAVILASTSPLPKEPLRSILNLSAFLVFSLPSFAGVFFSRANRDDELPTMLHVLSALVDPLTPEVVTFLHALSWSLREDHLPHVGSLLRLPGFLPIVIKNGGSAAIRTLALLASYPSMRHDLLAFPHGERGDLKNIPLVERLSEILRGDIDGERQVAALTCIGQLALSHGDARMLLADQNSLVPALVQLVWNLVASFWDNGAHSVPSTAIRVLQQAVHVMHHLAVSQEGLDQLRGHLQGNSGEMNYMFAVAIGRLAYADQPERLSEGLRGELRKLTEFARDLLEIVVDGPEMDEIYNAYQWDEGEPESAANTSASVTEDEDSMMDDDFED